MTTASASGPLPAGARRPIVAHQLQVPHRRLRVELFEDAVAAIAGGEARDAAVGIVQIAEHDRFGRARLFARRLDRAVLQRLAQTLRLDLVLLDPLYAERALLHHAARPDRDVRIEHQVLQAV